VESQRLREESVATRKGPPALILILASISIGIWTVVVATLSIRSESLNEFWYLVLPRISAAISSGVLAPIAYTPFWETLVVQLTVVTSLPLSDVLLLPIGAVVIPATLYALSSNLGLSKAGSLLIVGFAAFDIARGSSTYSVFAHAVSYPLVFIFISATVAYSRRPQLWVQWSIILTLLFVVLHFLYYSAELLALAFVISYAVFAQLKARLGTTNATRSPLNLAIAFVVLFFAFNEIVYQGYLPALSSIPPQEAITWISGRLAGIIGIQQATDQPFVVVAPQSAFVSLLVTIQIAAILAPFSLLLLIQPITRVRRYPCESRLGLDESGVVWPSIITSIIDFAAYFLLGFVNLRTILMLLPITAFLVLLRISARRRKERTRFVRRLPMLFLAFLVVTAIAKNAVIIGTTPEQLGSTLAQVKPGTDWLLAQGGDRIGPALTDLNTATRLSLAAASSARVFDFRSYNSSLYSEILDSSPERGPEQTLRYLIIDLNGLAMPIDGFGWKTYQPLSDYYGLVRDNIHLNLIYDDQNLQVYAFN